MSRRLTQQNLFPMEGAPDGLMFEAETMTATEEAAFLKVIKEMPFGPFRMHGVDAKRHVVRFGGHYLSGSAKMKPTSEFPRSLKPLRARAAVVSGGLCTPFPNHSSPNIRQEQVSLAPRLAAFRNHSGHIVRRRVPHAISTGGWKATPNLEPRTSSSITLRAHRQRTRGLAAQHPGREGEAVFHHVSNTEGSRITKT